METGIIYEEPIKRFFPYALSISTKHVQHLYGDKLMDAINSRGQNTAQSDNENIFTHVKLSALLTSNSFINQLDWENIYNQANEYHAGLLQGYGLEDGWEQDIVAHAEQIDDIFDGFTEVKDGEALTPITKKLTERLGWDFNILDIYDSEGFIDWFHFADQLDAKYILEDALAVAPVGVPVEDVIEEALKKADFGDFMKRFTYSSLSFVENELDYQHKEDLDAIEAQYGIDTRKAVSWWIVKREQEHLFFEIEDEDFDDMEVQAERRLNELKSFYLTQEHNAT